MTKKGFTLLELLIVVLIIGLLASIALPQYQLAVDKAKFSNFQSLVKSIETAFDGYYLIHDEYPNNFNELDINFDSSYEHRNYLDREGCVIFNDSYCCVGIPIDGNQSMNLICGKNDYTLAYAYYSNRRYCISANGNHRTQRLCENLNSGTYHTANMITPFGHNTNSGNRYSWYILR